MIGSGREYIIRALAHSAKYHMDMPVIITNTPPSFPTPSKRQRIARKKRQARK